MLISSKHLEVNAGRFGVISGSFNIFGVEVKIHEAKSLVFVLTLLGVFITIVFRR